MDNNPPLLAHQVKPDPNRVRVSKAVIATARGASGIDSLLRELHSSEDMSPDLRQQYVDHAAAFWDAFYQQKTRTFFKDRHNLRAAFPEMMPEDVIREPQKWHPPLQVTTPKAEPDEIRKKGPPSREDLETQGRVTMMEVGCGVGNACFPLLRANPKLFCYATDFSPTAVDLVLTHPEYDPERVFAFVGDMTLCNYDQVVPKASLDFITAVWALSAVDCVHLEPIAAHFFALLKPGGYVMIRDYAAGDLAELRQPKERKIAEHFFLRGDGTMAYYFSTKVLGQVFEKAHFELIENEYINREIVNRKQNLTMQRTWIQAKFRKPLDS